ncbi:DUF6221 family protein [Streptomyces niveiscabiei]|uniref:DUF6221 family protein n=1 Tax=Streptomyces niveiscabiei TaxID=164115 RepID=UPI0006EBCCA3|nr:DUF6221 family protein [Streptomyces niveiscabiei]
MTLSDPIDPFYRDRLVRWLRERLDEDQEAVTAMSSVTAADRRHRSRAVREIHAKRRLLASYEAAARLYEQAAAVVASAHGNRAAGDVIAYETTRATAKALDGAVRLAAYPYQTCPGYLEAWRP